jgi:hypothetical protein
MHPMARGSVPGGVTSSSGYGSGAATVYGTVWLDSDYDGYIDNGELGYSGASVYLVSYDPTTGQYSVGQTPDITDSSGNYSFTVVASPTYASYYGILVAFPWSFFATQEIGDSLIDAQGESAMYAVYMGGAQKINAGISSMNVNTTQDDANNQKIQDKVMLRDAIQTGNNGPPQPAVTFNSAPNTPLSGTITLQAALPAIQKSYDVNGPGSGVLTVNGNNNAIFTIDAGVTSGINELFITGGSDSYGGGIFNSGTLSLTADVLTKNQALGGGVSGGGAIDNAKGASLTMTSVTVSDNTTDGYGGGILNYGTLVCNGCSIGQNNANDSSGAGYGGGLANLGGSADLKAGVGGMKVNGNEAGNNGGGIYEAAGTVTITGSTVAGTIQNNSALQGGGAYVAGGTLTVSLSITISGNKATGVGGGWDLKRG